jgi:hypothetical protein
LYEGKSASSIFILKMANYLNHVGLTLPKSSLPHSLHSAFSSVVSEGIICYIDGSYL